MKKSKHFIYIMLITLILVTYVPLVSFAAGVGKKLDQSDGLAHSIMDSASGSIYYKQGDDIYVAEKSELFNYLKETYKNWTTDNGTDTGNPILDKSGKQVKWEKIGNLLDGLDAMQFQALASMGSGTTMFTLRYLVAPVLEMKQEDVDSILIYYSYIKPIGITLCLAHLMVHLIGLNIRELKSFETIGYALIRYGVAFFIVANSEHILGWMFDLSNAFMNIFVSNEVTLENTKTLKELAALAIQADKDGVLESLGSWAGNIVTGTITSLATSIISVIAVVLCYSRKIEIAIRGIFLPIAIADMSATGTNGNGMRYLKKMVGVMLQAGGIVFMFSFVNNLGISGGTGLIQSFALPIALLGSIGTAKRIAEESFG